MTQISLRLSEREKEHLQKYCELTQRNQTEVLRDLIRKLSIKGALNPLD
ncbi:ribbon-helix-helix protein, CopG family [Desmonostoc muscorum LEGE 12446]|nr:ribbon-helix-helix protein, CopG family [Desmonostoc muscorum]MCF2148246.1 ribbon-helix-helix protein, CopG family [Desmonostoc muscorum LEGE 12446]